MRIINLSEKYNKRPSEILGISDYYISFCFDEAIQHILSYREYDEEKKKEVWKVQPKWIDEEEKKKNNNSELINEMLEAIKESR